MNPTARNYLRYTSWPIIAAMVALMVVGVTAIRISEKSTTDLAGFSQKQAIFAMAGLGVFVLMTLVPYVHLGRLSYAIFALTMLSLVGIFALHPIRGSHRWIPLGPIMVQPSEIAKFSVIIMLAWYLRYGSNYRRLLGLIVPFVLTLLPMALVLIEPDLGTALLFPPTLMFMLFIAGARLRHLAVILLLGLLLVFVPVLLPVDKAQLAQQRSWFSTRTLGPLKFYSLNDAPPSATRPAAPSDRPELPVAYCRVQLGQGSVYDLQPLALRVMMGTDQTAERYQRVYAWLNPDDERLARGKGYQPRSRARCSGPAARPGEATGTTTTRSSSFCPMTMTISSSAWSVASGACSGAWACSCCTA